MFDTFQNRLVITGPLRARTALRVGTGRGTDPAGTDLPVIRDAMGRPYIPGSSFKGVLRSRVESFARAVAGQAGACNPVGPDNERCISNAEVARLKQRYRNDDETLANELLKHTCLVCQIFGSPWFSSKVQVKDLLVNPEEWLGQFQVRDGVAIDRDTKTAGEGLLYSYEVVPAGVSFNCHIEVENADDWQLGMILLGLAPFERGQISLGGGGSRGLGQVQLEDPVLSYFSLDGDDKVDQLIGYLQGEGTGEPVHEKQQGDWIDAFRAKLKAVRAKTDEEGKDA